MAILDLCLFTPPIMRPNNLWPLRLDYCLFLRARFFRWLDI